MLKLGILYLLFVPLTRATIDVCLFNTDLSKEPSKKDLSGDIDDLWNQIEDFLNNDTYTIDFFHINLTHPAISVYGDLYNLTVSNMKEYEFYHFTNIDFTSEFVIMSLTLKTLKLSADYDLIANIGDLFNVFGKGPFWYDFFNFTINVTGNFIFNETATCITIGVDITLTGAKGHFDNLMDDDDVNDEESLGEIINRTIQAILVDVIEIIWKDEKEWNDKKWEEIINNEINSKLTSFLELQPFY